MDTAPEKFGFRFVGSGNENYACTYIISIRTPRCLVLVWPRNVRPLFGAVLCLRARRKYNATTKKIPGSVLLRCLRLPNSARLEKKTFKKIVLYRRNPYTRAKAQQPTHGKVRLANKKRVMKETCFFKKKHLFFADFSWDWLALDCNV